MLTQTKDCCIINLTQTFTCVNIQRGEKIYMQLSKNKILVAMAQNNYTTKDLAKAYGVSCSRINFILNSREVRPTTVAKLSKALGVDVTELLED